MERRTEEVRERGVESVVFVCTNERATHACCADADGAAVAEAVRDWLRDRDRYWSPVAVAETSCLGTCGEDGAAIHVSPAGEWFANVTVDDVPTLLAEVVDER